MLWKRRISIAAVWVVVGGAGLAVVWKWPAIYKTEALILVDSQKIPEKFVSSTVSSDLQDRLASINQQILSSSQLKKIMDDFGLYREERKTKYEEEVLELMRRNISVVLEKGWIGNRPGAFRVGFQDPDPAIAARVANRIANLYIEENLKTREVQAEGTSEFLETQLGEAKRKLDDLEAAVSQYKLKHNGELPEQENALIGALSRLQVALEANRDALNRGQQTRVTLESSLQTAEDALAAQNRPARAGVPPAAEPELSGLPTAQPGRKRSEILEGQLELLRLRYSDNYPDVKRLKEDISNLREQEAAEEKASAGKAFALPPRIAAAARPKVAAASPQAAIFAARVQDLRERLGIVNTEIESRKTEQTQILRDIAATQGKVNRLPIREQEMAGLLRDYGISKANYQSLLDKKFSAAMSTDMERRQKSERFTVIDPAAIPMLPVKPNRVLWGALVALGSLALGLAIGLVNEIRQNVLLGEWELPPNTTILATLPSIRIKAGARSAQSGERPHGRALRIGLSVAALCVVTAVATYFIARPF